MDYLLYISIADTPRASLAIIVLVCLEDWSTAENSHMRLYLRNEFNFWNAHGIMNTSGLLQS